LPKNVQQTFFVSTRTRVGVIEEFVKKCMYGSNCCFEFDILCCCLLVSRYTLVLYLNFLSPVATPEERKRLLASTCVTFLWH